MTTSLRTIFTALREKFNQEYFSQGGEGNTYSTTLRPPIPVERVIVSSFQQLSSVEFFGQDDRRSLGQAQGRIFASTLEEKIIIVGSQQTLLLTFLPSGSTSSFQVPSLITGGLCLLSPERLLIFLESGISLFTLAGAQLANHQLPNQQRITHSLAVSEYQAVVATSDNALYIISTSSEPTISHQLMIAPSETSLGKIRSIASSSQNMLCVVGSAAILILDLTVVDRPKLLFKKVSKSVSDSETGVWLGSTLLLAERGIILVPTGEGFQSKLLTVRFPERKLFALTDRVVALVGENQLRLGELVDDRINVLETSHPLPQNAEVIVPRNSQSIFVVSIKPAGTNNINLDIHRASLVRWTDLVLSLCHSEKYCEAIALLLDLTCGHLPLLIDSRDSLVDPTLVVGLVGKFSKTPKFSQHEHLAVRLGSVCGCLEEVCETFSSRTAVLELVVKHEIPTSSLTQEIVMQTVNACVSHADIDAFIATVIVRGGRDGEVLVDTNQIVRIATARDFSKSIVLIHSYLLNDHLFPLKYWLIGEKVDMNLVCYYMHCLSTGRRFPCMEVPFPEGPEVMRSLVREERSLFEKIFLRDPETVVESIGYEFAEEIKILASQHPDLKEIVKVYQVKCAIANGEKIELKSVLPTLIARHELEVILDILEDGSAVPPQDLMMIFEQLVKQNQPEKIVKFALKFKLSADECVAVCLKAGKRDIAVRILVKVGNVPEAVHIVAQEQEFDRKIEMAVWVTCRGGKGNPEEAIQSLWRDLLLDPRSELLLNRSDVKVALAGAVDIFALVEHAPDLKLKAWLMDIQHAQHKLLKQAAAVAARDVGEQFVVLASSNSVRNKAVTVTASICHSCLDPITTAKSTKRNELMLFSCGHIVHSSCGDQTGCPVCV